MKSPLNQSISQLLKSKCIRITNPRRVIAEHLFQGSCRHLTAEQLANELKSEGHNIALATVYNTLNIFSDKGLLKVVPLTPVLNIYDTNTSSHHHIYNEITGEIIDAPNNIFEGQIQKDLLPEGVTLTGIDVVLRVQ
ncbi:MAG: transcriptional repressor [Myxococcota bacterium]|nr:transcriptional repressor [Myxococcota bacterium]